MDPNESFQTPDQPQQSPFVEQPGQPAWNTQPGQSVAGFPPNPAQISQGQTLPPPGYFGATGSASLTGNPETTFPPRVPTPNSVPIQGTFDPTTGQFTPSQPFSQYMTPPSQPLYGSSPQWPATGPASVPLAAPATTHPRVPWKIVTIIASILVILAVAAGGLVYVSAQNRAAHLAASKAADALCAHLVAKDYSSVYADMSSSAQAQYSSSLFGQLMTTLDQLEGNITSCHQAAGAYSYQSGANTAGTTLEISRATLGVLSGPFALQKEGGVWKTTMLPTALLGVNPGALSAVDTFCSELQSQRYSNLDSFLGSGDAVQMTASDFEINLKLQDLFNGSVSDCKITRIAAGNTDSTSTMTLSVTRTKTQPQSGQISLTGSGSAWTLSSMDPSVIGTDYRPLVVGDDFCTDLENNNLGAAYKLFDSGFQQTYSEASVVADFNESGWSYVCGDPDISTYSTANSTATYQLDVGYQGRDAYHNSGTWRMTLEFSLEGGSWYLDGYKTINK